MSQIAGIDPLPAVHACPIMAAQPCRGPQGSLQKWRIPVQALLTIDVQQAMITGVMYRERDVLDNILHLLAAARSAGILVVFVRHDYGAGHEWAMGTPGWQIWEELAPLENELIVDKRRSSAFLGTRLAIILREQGIKDVIITGVHTEYCINAAVLGACDQGFNVTIPELTNTTHGNEYMTAPVLYEYYHRKIWQGRYATVTPLEDVIFAMTSQRS